MKFRSSNTAWSYNGFGSPTDAAHGNDSYRGIGARGISLSHRDWVLADGARADRGDSPLPIEVQIIGPYLEDRTVLAFASMVEREHGGFVTPPGYAS